MSRFLETVHDAWCELTRRCRLPAQPPPPEMIDEDHYLSWLKSEREQSRARVAERKPTRDFLDTLLTGRDGHGDL